MANTVVSNPYTFTLTKDVTISTELEKGKCLYIITEGTGSAGEGSYGIYFSGYNSKSKIVRAGLNYVDYEVPPYGSISKNTFNEYIITGLYTEGAPFSYSYMYIEFRTEPEFDDIYVIVNDYKFKLLKTDNPTVFESEEDLDFWYDDINELSFYDIWVADDNGCIQVELSLL